MFNDRAVENNNETVDTSTDAIKEVANGGPNFMINSKHDEGIPGVQRAKGTDLGQGIPCLLSGSVRDFYSGTTVFLTGGTGFLGKAILEKLLRSCEGIKNIYILMRKKRGLDLQQRHKVLIENQIFDTIRCAWPERLSKIKPVSGDVTLPELGLSPADRKLLVEEVNIVIHSAATIRFDEPLAMALNFNTMGCKRIIDLCHKINNIKSIVHVSTAYSNSDTNVEILEKFYPVNFDPDFLLDCSTNLSQSMLDAITPQIKGHHANTYTTTKALAEQIVLKHGVGLPICILRPSIITAAYHEPFPGWVDNFAGPTGLMIEISRGTVRSVLGRADYIVDLIPLDLVVNACISSAWHHTNYTTPEPIIYNCTSSSVNSLTWGDLAKHTLQHAKDSPTQYVQLYPNFGLTTFTAVQRFWELSTHYLPSLIFDVLLRLQGKPPIVMKMTKRFKSVLKIIIFFTTNQFIIRNDNMTCLVNDLRTTGEYSTFFSDVNPIHWETYLGIYTAGIRKFMLKDTSGTMLVAKQKIRKQVILDPHTHEVDQRILVLQDVAKFESETNHCPRWSPLKAMPFLGIFLAIIATIAAPYLKM